MGDISQFRFPTDIRFGAGSRSVLAEFAETHQVNQPLLVTDNALTKTEAYNLVNETMKQVWGQKFSTFSGVHPNPTDKDVDQALGAYQKGNCDGIVGLGGGSALDAARALRLKAIFPERKLLEMPFDNLPKLAVMCAIPTTAGTGSEVGRSSVITITELGGKKVFGAGPLMAQMAILDAELTVGLPANLTAWTGMDAMTHAVEAYVCPIFHPMCDAIALEAIRMVRTYLRRAYENGKDIEARGMMQVAAAMGAVAFQKDLGAAHSLSHPLSSEFGIQHGLANAIALPAVVRFNGQDAPALYERAAIALGLEASEDSSGQVADFLIQFNSSIGITQRLRDLDVPRDKLDDLSGKAMDDGCHLSNPRKCTKENLFQLYEEIW